MIEAVLTGGPEDGAVVSVPDGTRMWQVLGGRTKEGAFTVHAYNRTKRKIRKGVIFQHVGVVGVAAPQTPQDAPESTRDES